MVEIELTKGCVTLVDDEDGARVRAHPWFTVDLPYGFYAARTLSRSIGRPQQYLHRLLLGEPAGQVDHIDGNGLDNRRANLRVATRQQNNWNTRSRPGTSRFKGVSWEPRRSRWRVQIVADGRSRHVGTFRSEDEAASAYDEAARESFGPYAALNFPRPGERGAARSAAA